MNNPIVSKVCSKCDIAKPLSEYGKDASRASGLNYSCKSCIVEKSAKTYALNPEKEKLRGAKYRANHKSETKKRVDLWAIANKTRKTATNAAWQKANAKRRAKTVCDWNERNPGRKAFTNARWKSNNKGAIAIHGCNRRAKIKSNGGDLSKDIVTKLLKLQKGKCPCCNLPLGENYHLDHITALANGGSNTDDNVQLLRAKCNLQKSAKHPIDFMRERGFLI